MTSEQIVAMVTALLAGEPDAGHFPVIAEGGADPRYEVTAAPCPRPLAPAEIEGETIVCGTVNVPLNHDNPAGTRIDLTFGIYRARSLSPAPDPVVHLHGGPGGGVMQTIALTTLVFEDLRARRDIVAFDQRGVDASGAPTRCFETIGEYAEPLAEAMAGTDIPVLGGLLAESCLNDIAAHGIDVSFINTEQNARDVSALMSALGYERYNVYGISYGTQLGLEVMRTAPEGVRAVVLDSVAPQQFAMYDTLLIPHWESVERTFNACASQPDCAAAYPNGADRYWALVEDLNDTPIETSGGTITGDLLYGLTMSRNGWSDGPRGLTSYLPLIVDTMEQGDTSVMEAWLEGDLPVQTTTETILTEAGPLSPADEALASVALDAADQMEAARQIALGAVAALETDLTRSRADLGLSDRFDEELSAALDDLPGRDERLAFARDYLRLWDEQPSAPALIGFVATQFDGDVRNRLLSLVGLMSEAEIADTFDRIARDNGTMQEMLMGDFELMIYACQEDMDINSMDGMRTVNASIDMAPSIEAATEDAMAEMYRNCERFEQHPRPGFHDPIVSDIPTLAFGGELDTQTAASWAEEVASILPNGRSVVFPEAGHGSVLFSQCARDLGVAFIDYPDAPLNTACVADLEPRFVLPDGTMSGG